jgi:ankyrin repeat protein
MFSGNKDVDRFILLKLESDREILEFCALNKYAKNLCNDDFFRNRVYQKFPNSVPFKTSKISKTSTWKKYYLYLIYYIDKMKDLGFNFSEVSNGDVKSYYEILKDEDRLIAIVTAIEKDYLDLVKYYIEDKNIDLSVYNTNYNILMAMAAENGHKSIVDYFISKGANDWNQGMAFAIKGGQTELVNFFIEKGAKNWNIGLYSAAVAGNRDLILFFMKRGNTKKSAALDGAAYGGHVELVKMFFENGAKDIDSALKSAVKGYEEHEIKSREVIRYLISLGANVNVGLIQSARVENPNLISFFIRRGADNFEQASDFATAIGSYNLAKYFREMDRGYEKFNKYIDNRHFSNINDVLIHVINEFPDEELILYLIAAGADKYEGLIQARKVGNEKLINIFQEL